MNQPLPRRNPNLPPKRPVSEGGPTALPQSRAGGVRPSSKPVRVENGGPPPKRPVAAPQPQKRPSAPVQPAEVERKPQKPASMEELIAAMVRYAIKQSLGIGIAEFDEKLLPRMKEMLPQALQGAAQDALREHLLSMAHALYVAIVCGQFKERPVLCGVRAAELAADLTERVLSVVGEMEEERLSAIRCRNVLVGLTLQAVRLLETTNLERESLKGFTDNYERAVIIAYGLKTQAEATGTAPWSGMKDNPLDKRIGATINTMSNVFGDYIAGHSKDLSEEVNQSVLAEFDGFMERFAPYIEGGHTGAAEKSKKLQKSVGTEVKRSEKVEPLEIAELRTRPAGVEIRLADGRKLFVSSEDARKIGKAADGEVDDTAKRKREELEKRQSDPGIIDGDAPVEEAAQDEVMRSVEKGPSRKHAREQIEQRKQPPPPPPPNFRAPAPRPRAR